MNPPIQNVVFVQIADAQHHFRTIKPCALFGESNVLFLTPSSLPHLLQVVKQRTTRQERHSHKQLVFRLECKRQPAQERGIHLLQNLPLALRVLDLVARHDLRLLEDLQRVHAFVVLVAHQKDLAERAAADHAEQLEVVH